jgi:hypothetical protein
MQTSASSKMVLGILSIAAGVAVFVLIAGFLMTASPASASPKWAQQTGKPCGFCHGTPPALNEQGKKFAAKGHKL